MLIRRSAKRRRPKQTYSKVNLVTGQENKWETIYTLGRGYSGPDKVSGVPNHVPAIYNSHLKFLLAPVQYLINNSKRTHTRARVFKYKNLNLQMRSLFLRN